MRLAFEPIGPHHRDALIALLAPFGLPAEIVEWKYFGRPASLRGPSGFVWTPKGTVRGVLGLVPFSLTRPTGVVPASWTCDWLVESPERHPGVGVLLLRHALERVGPLYSLGGNTLTRQLMPRIASSIWDDGVQEVHLALRLGGSRVFRAADARLRGALTALRGVRVRPVRLSESAVIRSGVSPQIAPLLDITSSDWVPTYGLEQVQWLLEACPALHVVTCLPDSSDVRAAALCWRTRVNVRDWRISVWSRDGAEPQARAVLATCVAHVARERGERVSIAFASSDSGGRAFLRASGFRDSSNARPVYVTAPPGCAAERPARLGFLDGDLAYRF